ncbi:GNAT family N-acetyltransferase [uncultured Pelagimonas sp.]|uniref:GNAT family N-acetyltransferase n=1 Tax=uncultured Pelagimonas sp. TaxID=1618102 RepID=UPI0026018C7A|nr:GNAT family N-acetyltransferase [uncultured Pelagimonas sp.]
MTPERLLSASDQELAALSDLCLRSKAYWGYDADFLDACREELTVTHADLGARTAVIRKGAGFIGVATVTIDQGTAQLNKLFVDPDAIGSGAGRALLLWAIAQARSGQARIMNIDADPGAEAFYAYMGAIRIGSVASTAISGRMLPLMQIAL